MRNVLSRLNSVGLFLVLLLLVTSTLSAYVLYSPRRQWPNPPTYIVDNRGLPSVADGDGGVSRTVAAITSTAAWNGSGAALGTVIQAQAGSVAAFSVGDGKPMLNFRDPFNICASGCLAATFISNYVVLPGTSRITDADIITNSTAYNWTSQGEDPGGSGCFAEYYVEAIHVHETGHGLGLAHSSASGATMNPFVSSCDNGNATTSGDDEAGIRDLYACRINGAHCLTHSECCSGTCAPFFPGAGTFCQ